MEHANLLALHHYQLPEVGEADPSFAVVDLCTKGDLFDLLQSRGRLAEPEARWLFGQMLDGIEHMHAVGYAHRDIKPENVLLANDYTVRLADFGFATAKLQATEVAGTPNYASPEMRAGTQYNT